MPKRTDLGPRAATAPRLLACAALALLALLALPATTFGQWSTTGSDISTTNTGNVGVGTSAAPAAKLDVIGPLTGNGPTIRAGGGGDLLLASGGSLFFDGNYSYAAGNYIRPLSANSQSFFTSGVERLRIGATGNVGVGTAAPGYRLHVAGDNTDAGGYPVIKLQNTQAAGHSFWLYSGAAGAPGAFGLYDETAGRYRLFVDSSGNVGVGTTSPAGVLHVPTGTVFIGQNTGAGAVLRVGRIDSLYPAIVSASNYSDAANPVFLARSFGPWVAPTGNGVYNFLGTDSDTTRTFSADYAGNGYFAGALGVGTTGPGYKLDVQGGQINASGGLCIAGVCKATWSEVGGASQWAIAGTSVYYSAGGVGIGTATPQNALTVARGGSAPYAARPASELLQLVDKTDNTPQIFFGTTFNGMQLRYTGTDGTAANQRLGVVTGGAGEAFVVNNNGQVGIGTTTPQKALDVVGDMNASGTITGGNIQAKFQDVAEWVPSSKLIAPGTVVVLDPAHSNQVTSSVKAYDTRVAGVVSPQPGITLGERGEGKALVATTGRVKVKVDATRAPIAVGDLLVTSDAEGVAMKSVPVALGGVEIHRPGTIIGKALEPLEKGTGEILVLLSLQ